MAGLSAFASPRACRDQRRPPAAREGGQADDRAPRPARVRIAISAGLRQSKPLYPGVGPRSASARQRGAVKRMAHRKRRDLTPAADWPFAVPFGKALSDDGDAYLGFFAEYPATWDMPLLTDRGMASSCICRMRRAHDCAFAARHSTRGPRKRAMITEPVFSGPVSLRGSRQSYLRDYPDCECWQRLVRHQADVRAAQPIYNDPQARSAFCHRQAVSLNFLLTCRVRHLLASPDRAAQNASVKLRLSTRRRPGRRDRSSSWNVAPARAARPGEASSAVHRSHLPRLFLHTYPKPMADCAPAVRGGLAPLQMPPAKTLDLTGKQGRVRSRLNFARISNLHRPAAAPTRLSFERAHVAKQFDYSCATCRCLRLRYWQASPIKVHFTRAVRPRARCRGGVAL